MDGQLNKKCIVLFLKTNRSSIARQLLIYCYLSPNIILASSGVATSRPNSLERRATLSTN